MKHGFTLAEMLITLTIIGVIAALTIPNLMKNAQEHAWHQQWKSDFTILNNAFKSAVSENPDLIISKAGIFGPTPEFANAIVNKLKVVETCGYTHFYSQEYVFDDRSCNNIKQKWANANNGCYKTLSNQGVITSEEVMGKAALLNNGASIYISGVHSVVILVDVNNHAKGPNIIGKDVYAVHFMDASTKGSASRSGKNASDFIMVPYGVQDYTYSTNTADNGTSGCSPTIGRSVAGQLMWASGIGCSYKYLYDK